MSIENAREYLKKCGVADRINELSQSSATVELAAQALGCNPERIAKSMSFKIGEKCILIVTAGDVKIDNAKYKNRFNVKAKMLTPEEVIENIGHAVGGVCPFGIKENVDVYLDEYLKRFESVFPACGSSNSTIELTIPELEKYSNSIAWVDVCKMKE